jgi:saccharopine dehydrogenase-like NADP-dependent oxidoreductase
LIDFDEIGTLESFNTDGLRTILKTIPVKNMKEKTLRYPGHRQMMELLRDAGFFNTEAIELNGKPVRPIDVTAKLLFPQWKYADGEEEFTVMRVIIEGQEKGKQKKYRYDLLDRYNRETKTSSMARTTGYTCAAAANLILENHYSQKGIIPPEYLGRDEHCYHFILSYLREIRQKVNVC